MKENKTFVNNVHFAYNRQHQHPRRYKRKTEKCLQKNVKIAEERKASQPPHPVMGVWAEHPTCKQVTVTPSLTHKEVTREASGEITVLGQCLRRAGQGRGAARRKRGKGNEKCSACYKTTGRLSHEKNKNTWKEVQSRLKWFRH